MAASNLLPRIRKERAEARLEIELWDVINKPQYHEESKREAALTRLDIMRTLLGMAVRLALEIERNKRS